MVSYRWDNDKNVLWKQTRGITFEQVVMHIENGDVLDVMVHPNKTKCPNQQILIVDINDYIYAVPFIEEGQEYLLKTIVPSRKLTKQYLR
uniref:Ribonuclease toxin, BrnT, of type II toxin-antitoxin system n=1 Tax=Candidatus Kentrum sp. FW TaxID=2126338 RepID=A0A450SAQ5_9GAMM|nr:MAG: Ribonuclease toxin, BrnT, of type II toxin-antitoxin system [Candidatus Kentron sp. FW]VFJ49256.1 MAG: Ribonuclease toxin, BrnT, of type II toxin-antitoxin system [Candidatus Kentron sp. FW]